MFWNMLEQQREERRACVEGSAAVKEQKEKYIHGFNWKLQCVCVSVCVYGSVNVQRGILLHLMLTECRERVTQPSTFVKPRSTTASLCNFSQLRVNWNQYFRFLAFPHFLPRHRSPAVYSLPVLVSVSYSLTPESDSSLTDSRLITASVEATMTACNLNHTLTHRFLMGGLMRVVQRLITNVEEKRKKNVTRM